MGSAARWWRHAAAALALLGAGATASMTAAPAGNGWRADPDEQFMLDVRLRQLRLGEGVRAYATPTGTCLVLGDFLQALDVPMKIDLTARRATGWAFKQDQTIDINTGDDSVTVKSKRESLADGDIREVPEGWCASATALARWLGVTLDPETAHSLLLVGSEFKLPVELAAERRLRASSLKYNVPVDLKGLPRVKLPYRLWRAPALEFVVNAGATYDARTGVKVDRSIAVAAAGEIAAMSYQVRVSSGRTRLVDSVYAKLYRFDPDGKILGPLRATQVAIGDIEGLRSTFGGTTSASGRGAMISNQPINTPTSFDRTAFTGDLPDGWDAELYRNGGLIAFSDGSSGDGRYHFNDVDLHYGDNRFEIVLYGPQGQVQRREQTLNVGQQNVPPGKLWYWAGIRQPDKPVLEFAQPPPPNLSNSLDQTTFKRSNAPEMVVEARYGVTKRLSVAALVRSAEIQHERLTFVEGSVRYSIGPALTEFAAAVDTHGRFAARAQIIAKLGPVNVTAGTFRANGFAATNERGQALKSEHRLSVAAPIVVGHAVFPVSADLAKRTNVDGSRELDAAARLGASFGRFNLNSETIFRRKLDASGSVSSERVDTILLASARVGRVRVRGSANWQMRPERQFDRAEVSAYWSAGEKTDWEAGVAYEADAKRYRGRLSYIRRFNAVGVALTGEAASDGSVAAGINLNFALDPFNGRGLRPTRDKLASTGTVQARVFEDLNENGRLDHGEPLARDAIITAGLKLAEQPTDKDGMTRLGGLSPYLPVGIGIDQSSLANPALAPSKPVQVVIPRPGIAAQVDIALVGGGSAEGFAVKEDGSGYEGLEIQLVGADGEVLGTAISDIDGYFLFERVRYGSYRLRLTAATAKAISANPMLDVSVTITNLKPLARLGPVKIIRATTLALAQ
ncbi:hypothetical protein [Sphingomonas sp.]|uniref:hypothetical protein n=1 Tax=Sphingomonas sp. TaxID=28214 RepID=UPI00286C26AA|nr:hypothetical protein [Sphingomonas sp.]